MDDRWRDTYDAWKTRAPDDDGPVCETCGAWLRRTSDFGWYCNHCEECEDDQYPGEDIDGPL